MTADDARKQRLQPRIVRGEHFACTFTPATGSNPPSLSGAAYRFAIGLDPENPLVEVTGTITVNGYVTNPSGTTLFVVLTQLATSGLPEDENHIWTLYVTPAGDEEYVWAGGKVQVVAGAGILNP